MTDFPPVVLFILGALLVPVFRGPARNWFVILIPAAAFLLIANLQAGASWQVSFLGYELTFLRVDKLSKVFGYIFTLNAFAAFIYAFYLRDATQHVAALFYIGSALGVVFAGDLISLYLFWEIMAVASTMLILARKSQKSLGAGFRYVLVHLVGGLCLLAGILFFISQTGTTAFEAMTERNLGTWLILIGFLVNAAAPPLHAWLADAYPEATVTGGVILSAYTTKTAVYTLIRGYPGWEILIVIGCLMTLYGIVYALLENDMRRILAYSIINQVGFMVTGVGIGTAMALNGAAAHAFCHIIYKSLLWMSAGAVLYMTGKSRCTDLGGLYKTMPWTLIFGTIGALAISSFPGTSGFTSKTLIIEQSVAQHLVWVWLVLEIASAGVFLHAGIKFPYFVFFAKDNGLRPGETNRTMLAAMGFMAFLCIFLGVYPQPLYDVLPFGEVHYQAYTLSHVVSQLQLLMLSALVFFLFLPLLKRTETISLDTDWFYRKGGRAAYRVVDALFNNLNRACDRMLAQGLTGAVNRFAANAPARASSWLLTPIYRLQGRNGDAVDNFRRRIQHAFDAGLAPLGISAAVSGLFVVLLFLLR
ncbi:MAG: Na(+)/H(+) antiporter subunit D [Desulfobacterales bacterium]|nr:Na(+)/H(+) antiporter subunit D [Desulfobacterales bacterium]